MINSNTLGQKLKRGILDFSDKISEGFGKVERRFISQMTYGLLAAHSCKLTDIGRALKENILIKKTVERLSRLLVRFTGAAKLHENYLKAVNPLLGEDSMIVLDGGDVTKKCSPAMEAIGSVYDGSEGTFADGFWTMTAVVLSEDTNHPIPVYDRVYECKKCGGNGSKAETAACLQFLREHYGASSPRVMDRGFDSKDVIKDLVKHGEKFIIRVNQNRAVIHGGQEDYVKEVAKRVNCTHQMTFTGKNGKPRDCRIGMTKLKIRGMKRVELTLVVCQGWGEDPLILYTNMDVPVEEMAVKVFKGYLMRWRIEEYHAFKKQGFEFEDFRVRKLAAIRNLNLLLMIVIGYVGMMCEKVNREEYVVDVITIAKNIEKPSIFIKKTKFLCYAVLRGITMVLAFVKYSASLPPPRGTPSDPRQLSLFAS